MPGLDGLDLARVLARFAQRPQVVFVTAYDEHAVDAFDLRAIDYVMKPVRAERLAEAVRRVRRRRADAGDPGRRRGADRGRDHPRRARRRDPVRPALARSCYVEAQGDYARLHTADGSPPRARPAHHARGALGRRGFVRIHRCTLVALRARQRGAHGRRAVHASWLGDAELQVSRRHTRELRDRLLRAPGARPVTGSDPP